MTLVASDAMLIGDSLCSLPFIAAMADYELDTHNRHLVLLFRNDEVYSLMPQEYKNKINRIETMEQFWNQHPAIVYQDIKIMDVGKCFSPYQSYHMVQGHFLMFGFEPPSNVRPLVEFEHYPDKDVYDWVITPYSRSDGNNNKLWPYNRWQQIIDKLLKINPDYKIAVLGAHDDPAVFKGVDHIFGKPLKSVCNIIYNVKYANLGIDSGLSHLCHGVAPEKHVLLYPQCLHPNWVGNPQALTIRGEPLNITVEQMWELVKQKI